MLKRFLQFYKPHKFGMFLDLTAATLAAACNLLYPIFTRNMIYTLIPNRDLTMLFVYAAALLGVYIAQMLLNYFMTYYGHTIGVRMQSDMRRKLFDHIQKLPFTYFDNNETGGIMSRLVNDLFEISELAHHGPEYLFTSVMSFVGSFIYLLTVCAPLTLIIFAAVPVLVFFSLKMRTRMNTAFTKTKEEVSAINATLENSVAGVRVAKAFTNRKYENKKFDESNNRFVVARTRAYKAMAQYHAGSELIIGLLNVIVLLAGGLFTINGAIDYADLITFMLFINMFINPIKTIINFMEQYQDGMAGFKRYIEIIDEPEEQDAPDAVSPERIDGNIEFDNVSFSYATGGEVLHNVNLSVPKGQTLALVGPSGGGKTTVCHLIPRFYLPTEGSVRLDGIDINKMSLDTLRRAVGIVQQDVFLFNGTIKENILYGKLDATDEEVTEAAKNANLYDFIMSLPDGFDTQVGERGVKLSGGQKQRISIARVFLKNPPVLILDEATSALDNATEMLIQSALNRLAEGRTTLIVAHRLSTIRSAQEIAVITDGKVAEKGTHDELLALPHGIYRALHDAQFDLNAFDLRA